MRLWSVAPYLSQCIPMPPKLRGLEIHGNSFFVVIFFDQRHVVNLHAAARKVFFTGNKKKPEVTDKHVYRIYRKILGFDVLFSDEISKKYLILYGE